MTAPADDLVMIERLEGLAPAHAVLPCVRKRPLPAICSECGATAREPCRQRVRDALHLLDDDLPRLLALARLGLEAEERATNVLDRLSLRAEIARLEERVAAAIRAREDGDE